MPTGPVRYAGGTDPGRIRGNNEDAWFADPAHGVFAVVDGIGGQAAGEKAAEIAVARLRARLERQTGTAEQRIREAITMANNEILHAASTRPEWEGMACVLTVAVLDDGSAVVGHVGDSRLYLVNSTEIRKVTHDHSPVGEREDNRELSEEEAMRHPRRNEVFRDVGSEERSPDDPDFIEVVRFPFPSDSALLLCSDGLSDQVRVREIGLTTKINAGDPQRTVSELIAAANRAGGKDNVTVVVVEGERFQAAAKEDVRPLWKGPAAMFLWGTLLAWTAALALYFAHKPVPPKPVHLPATITVDVGGASTITQALQSALPGDTVLVAPGEYAEQVQLKDRVKLVSRERNRAVLRAALSPGPAIIAGSGVNATVSGFTIVGTAEKPVSTGIDIAGGTVDASDMEIRGAGVGVHVRGSLTLSASTIQDCEREGVVVETDSQAVLSHNLIRNNKGAGISARGNARPLLNWNVFEKNPLDLPPEMAAGTKEHNVLLDVRAGRGGAVSPARKKE
jgi:serine/threonine protein phosphatase PrpC